jgi:transcriptional regulator of acetoin/glycerol metabolism
LAPGFSYAEELVGTNGIGTALEGGQPAHVFGHEHYAENLEDLACAGVPIHHPITGKTVGAVDLTCWRKDADPLLVALVKTTADQITQALLTDSSAQELELLQEYLRACRRTNGIVLALNDDVVMMNDRARQVLDAGDQAVLLGQAGEALGTGRPGAVEVELPTGLTARMYCRPTRSSLAGGLHAGSGGVVHVKLVEPSRRPAADSSHAALMLLPGVVGSGTLWLRGCQQVQEIYETGEWLVIEGEPGVGKFTLLRAVHQRRDPSGRFSVLDAADATSQDWLVRARHALLEGEGDLVIRHIDRLNARQAHFLASVLQEMRAAGQPETRRVTVTRTSGSGSAANLAELLRWFPRTAALPPLRHHVEDLPELVRFFIGKLSQHGRLTCSPEAMQLLARSTWPGNVEQLWQVMRGIVAHKRVGSIDPGDLPPECWTVSRRRLSPLEALERDAIVQSLLDSGGNKAKAAGALGMSRATIYRKIHGYGIVIPAR